jgi:membrane protease YdiL (CAAX protease family)
MEPNTSRVRDALVLAFAYFFPVVMALLYFVVLPNAGDKPGSAVAMTFSLGKFVQFALPIVYVWWFEPSQIRLARPTFCSMPHAIGFALIVGVLMFVLYYTWIVHIPGVAENTPAKIHVFLQEFHCTTPLTFLMMGIFICGIHSLLEEYYWRWFMFGWMRRLMPVWAAIVVSSVGFMLHHIVVLGVYFPGHFWTLAMPFSVCVGVGGGYWAWLYQRSGALYAPWLSHLLVDTAILLLGYEMLGAYW